MEDCVDRVGLVGLDGFWFCGVLFDLESLGEGDSVFVRGGDVEGGGVMAGLEKERERWCLRDAMFLSMAIGFGKVLALF